MGWEQIEHTADLGLHVWADGLEELFAEACRALFAVMGVAAAPADRSARVELRAPDLPALLADWLSELLYVFEGKAIAPEGVHVHVWAGEQGWRLEAEVAGCDAERFVQHGPAVKAVTYHELLVEARDGRWQARVYLDV